MFGRERFLLVYGISTEAWCKRYGIDVYEAPCSNCGAIRRITQPFFFRKLRGLIAEFCPCGSDDRPYAVVSTTGPGLSDVFNDAKE